MPDDFLKEIVAYKKSLLKEKRPFFDSLKKKIRQEKFSRYCIFKAAISRPGQVNLIAEIKKASPSQGVICPHFDLLGIAREYVNGGAAAISVLTEDKFFLGKPPFVRTLSENFKLPLLTKDFIIDEAQIYETLCFGASAVLLIAAILNDEQLKHLIEVAGSLDLDCLVEIHEEHELERALAAGAEIIGINNRNLHDFTVDFNTCCHIAPLVPKDKIIVAESGIKSHQEIKVLKELGVHAVLIGETFLRAENIGAKIKEVMHGA